MTILVGVLLIVVATVVVNPRLPEVMVVVGGAMMVGSNTTT